MDKLTGTIQGVGGITGSLSASGGMSGSISMPEVVPLAPYEGEYVVIPQVGEQVMPTVGKRMVDNVTVTGIPYYQVSNLSGLTVYIG
jgi:hypothetical protein